MSAGVVSYDYYKNSAEGRLLAYLRALCLLHLSFTNGGPNSQGHCFRHTEAIRLAFSNLIQDRLGHARAKGLCDTGQ